MGNLSKSKRQTGSSPVSKYPNCLEPLEMRRCLSGFTPAVPDNASALYALGYTEFRWQDSGSLANGHDPAVTYILEASPDGTSNWTALPPINATSAVTSGINRLWKDRHDRQKYYRMHAVDADGDVSTTTNPPFQVSSHPEDSVIEASATVQSSGTIALSWRPLPTASNYSILRRGLGSTGPFAPLLDSSSNPVTVATGSYTDATAALGSGYEYSIVGKDQYGNTLARAYVVSGSNLAPVEDRGKIVLLVDDSVAGALRGYIARLQSDLVGDGWTVLRHNVYRNQPVTAVKQLIHNDYDAFQTNGQSDVKQVLLLGHVPVPYSGSWPTDGHSASSSPPSHVGAWATDLYYGDMDGTWTDSSINIPAGTTNGFAENGVGYSNTPIDGRFDQDFISGALAPELAVGRIDMHDLPLATTVETEPLKREVELLKRYLRKDHEYRVGTWNVRKRAIIYNNWDRSRSLGGPSAYSNLSALVGSNNIDAGNYFPANKNHLTPGAADDSYIWGSADGPGTPDFLGFYGSGSYTSDGGAATHFLADATSPDVVFNQLYGSYFADWDRPNDFLRAAIAGNGYGLTSTSAIGATPNFWHMGMGETVGDNLLFTQRGQPNVGSGTSNSLYSVDRSTALMGDPTLRMAVVKPPTDVGASGFEDENGNYIADVFWTASADPSVTGYRVYRAASMDGPFTKISGSADLTGTAFRDNSTFAGAVYMVRAIKMEQGHTGTYYNASEGGFSQAVAGLVVGVGRDSRAYVGSIALTFNKPVTLTSTGYVLSRRDPSQPNTAYWIPNTSVTTDDGGLSYVITQLDDHDHPIPFDDGVYDVQIVPSEITLAGTTTTIDQTDHTYMFFRLAGDANGSGGGRLH